MRFELTSSGVLERVRRIELRWQGWRPRAQPMSHTREPGARSGSPTRLVGLEDQCLKRSANPALNILFSKINGQGGWLRSSGLSRPRRALYLAELRPETWSGYSESNRGLMVPSHGLDLPAIPRKTERPESFRSRAALNSKKIQDGLRIIAGDVIHRWRDGRCPLRFRTGLESSYH